MGGGSAQKLVSVSAFFALLLLIGAGSYLFYGDKGNTDTRSKSQSLQKPPYADLIVSSTPSRAPDKQPPTLTLKNPFEGMRVTKNTDLIIHAEASDPSGIRKIDFFINETLTCTDLTPIYTCTWKAPNVSKATSYKIKAEAYDNSGNRAVKEVSVTVNK